MLLNKKSARRIAALDARRGAAFNKKLRGVPILAAERAGFGIKRSARRNLGRTAVVAAAIGLLEPDGAVGRGQTAFTRQIDGKRIGGRR